MSVKHDKSHEAGATHDFHGGICGCCGPSATRGMSGAEVDLAVEQRGERLTRLDEVRGDDVDHLLSARSRRGFLKAGGLFGALAAAAPVLSRARAEGTGGFSLFQQGGGRVHVVESTYETTKWGIFDSNLPDIVQIESGDVVSYPNTWSHFLNDLQPGMPIEEIARLRLAHPGVGPHSIIGPVGVRDAEPGDVLEIQYLRVRPTDWAVCFNNPGALGTGALPDAFPQGQAKYFDLDTANNTSEFAPGIQLRLAPFQGTMGVAPANGVFPTPPGHAYGVISSVPPGQHAGNVDCREAGEGSRLFVPVFQRGGKIFTGDSHALQGDGEVTLTAMETAMKEIRVRVILHKQVALAWPMHETPDAWIVHGTNPDLDTAFRIALLNAIDFLEARAGLTRLDAYALCSLAVSFRVTQVVNGQKGIYGVIPKRIFHPQLRAAMGVI
ncbi:Acetamidase/Formamidase [Anaeromyxobacter dehalogenans 2CP-1]|uniref:Acetamidase/Formamidase n=1 Tax=Anaeromyxobacter dehalogenans (strain ATCC BAA-258 / DSM 21875 / 2CP-1) TaxID=455488 RepID=B8J6C2_ANAD2|nr:acetamidase/formamidase family protein [Anaeromyxobacter dehalogenans]ACL65103.1 Acetamidase/Formamidase [Anaeromyxobacter dehalogenans 2CP-1]